MNELSGRVAVVTGAGRGIGAGIARLLAQEGAAVVVNDLGASGDGVGADLTPAQEVVAQINAAGGKALVNGADVGDHEAAREMIASAVSEFGRLDILVNTAGILRDRMVFNMPEEDWDAVIRVHLKGHFNTIKAAAAHWRAQRDDAADNRIINFTSISGLHGAPSQPNYAAAKMGIVGLTMSCANALTRYGVTTNAISPGANTRLSETVPPDQRQMSEEDWAAMTPDRVAPVVAYIARPESRWLNGRVVDVRTNRVALYNIPEQVRVLESAQPWTTNAIGAAMKANFADLAAIPIRMPL
jgi:NAD(P)-dependent dehydrogenase (short-subunit alcohol dehydrogenase family)